MGRGVTVDICITGESLQVCIFMRGIKTCTGRGGGGGRYRYFSPGICSNGSVQIYVSGVSLHLPYVLWRLLLLCSYDHVLGLFQGLSTESMTSYVFLHWRSHKIKRG